VYSQRAAHGIVLVHTMSHHGVGSLTVAKGELWWWGRAVGPVFLLFFGSQLSSQLNSKTKNITHFPKKFLDVHPNMVMVAFIILVTR
jgi:uncharacterized membrane protein